MKTFFLILLVLIPSLILAQTNVDKLTRVLDSLTLASIDHWKMSPDLKKMSGVTGDPTQPGFDDSKWETLELNHSVYPDTCWLRKEIVLPQSFLGQPIKGKLKN